MADLSISGYVTRGASPNLTLNDATYRLMRDGFGPGERSFRRVWAMSPFVHGSQLVAAVVDQQTSPLAIRVVGSSQTDCWSKVGVLVGAFQQFSYDLVLSIGGEVFQFSCTPADSSVGAGGVVQDFHIRRYMQEVRFSIPRNPYSVSGPNV